MAKPALSIDVVSEFLHTHSSGVTDFGRLPEGEEAQAFRYVVEGSNWTLRIAGSVVGYEKDRYAADHYADGLPVPAVREIGWIDSAQAFCISELLPGRTLQDMTTAELGLLVEPVYDSWRRIAAIDISRTSGFGVVDVTGTGASATWRDYLLHLLATSDTPFPIDDGSSTVIIDQARKVVTKLIAACPEERALIHGDFGANNVLVEHNRITGILDWDCTRYGDPLFDVANVYFWSTWLKCMRLQAEYFEGRLASRTPQYRDRIDCCQLLIGLSEAYENARDGDHKMASWALARCAAILERR